MRMALRSMAKRCGKDCFFDAVDAEALLMIISPPKHDSFLVCNRLSSYPFTSIVHPYLDDRSLAIENMYISNQLVSQ